MKFNSTLNLEIPSSSRGSNFNYLYISLQCIGVYFVFTRTVRFLSSIKKYFYKPRRNFLMEYEPGWVLITGSSDGIGKSFAKEFAKRGFNILLCARNEEKLKLTKEELLMINKDIKVDYFQFDFSKNLLENKESLENIIDKYCISILVNNVGSAIFGRLEEMRDEELQNMININIISSIILTKLIISHILKRRRVNSENPVENSTNKKSLIITIGSDLSYYSPPFLQVYSGTKACLRSLMFGLEQENKNLGIDFTLVEPGPVKSASNRTIIPYMVDADEYVKRTFPQLGRFSQTYGHYWHAYKYWFYGENNFIYNYFTKKHLYDEFSSKCRKPEN